ncbi:hypothetical protein JCM8547_008945 [Rhodosporidiobolus lusitaniae]
MDDTGQPTILSYLSDSFRLGPSPVESFLHPFVARLESAEPQTSERRAVPPPQRIARYVLAHSLVPALANSAPTSKHNFAAKV